MTVAVVPSEPIRILLVNAINPNVAWETRFPHLGFGYLVSAVRRRLPQVQIEFQIIQDNVAGVAQAFQPHIVGISAVSQNFNIAERYAEIFAAQGIPVILGGIHVSVLPNCLPRNCALACLGESEQTFVEVIEAVLNTGLSTGNLARIKGIAFWDGDSLCVTPDRPVVKDLDVLPRPARDLMDISSHAHMFSSRGCPFHCRFCASTRYWKKLRFFSAQYVAEEIEHLVRTYKVHLISFFDDLFAANRPRLEEILRLLEKRKLLGKVSFTCNCRADIVTPELAGILARMGFVSVGMGLESGDADILRFLKGPKTSIDQNAKAIGTLKAAGIRVNASFVIGSPHETHEQMMKTYDFIRTSKLDLVDVHLLTPYPGTPIWEYAKEKKLVSDRMEDWSRLDVNAYRNPKKAIILSEVMSSEEVLAFYRKCQRMRFWRNLAGIGTHPLRGDIFFVAWKLLRDFLARTFGKG